MATRRLLVEINAGKRRCKGCEHCGWDVSGMVRLCRVYRGEDGGAAELGPSQCTDHVHPRRCQACLDAERRAAEVTEAQPPPDLPECVKRWQAGDNCADIVELVRGRGHKPDGRFAQAADVLDWAATLTAAPKPGPHNNETVCASCKHAELGYHEEPCTSCCNAGPQRNPAYEPRSMAGKP